MSECAVWTLKPAMCPFAGAGPAAKGRRQARFRRQPFGAQGTADSGIAANPVRWAGAGGPFGTCRVTVAVACCSARTLEADRRGNTLIPFVVAGSSDNAEQHNGNGLRYVRHSKVRPDTNIPG